MKEKFRGRRFFKPKKDVQPTPAPELVLDENTNEQRVYSWIPLDSHLRVFEIASVILSGQFGQYVSVSKTMEQNDKEGRPLSEQGRVAINITISKSSLGFFIDAVHKGTFAFDKAIKNGSDELDAREDARAAISNFAEQQQASTQH